LKRIYSPISRQSRPGQHAIEQFISLEGSNFNGVKCGVYINFKSRSSVLWHAYFYSRLPDHRLARRPCLRRVRESERAEHDARPMLHYVATREDAMADFKARWLVG